MTTLFDLVYYTYRGLHVTREGIATGGSATTLVDTIGLANFEDDHWKNGTMGILYDSAGEGAAPEGKFSVITDFVQLTSTITMGTVTTAVAASDRYFVTDDTFPLYDVIGFLNKNLAETEYPAWDETSLEIADNQTEYNLPVAAKRAASRGHLRVWLEGNDDDADDQRWTEIFNWRVEPSGAAGAVDILVLPYQYSAGYAIGLEYITNHAELWSNAAILNENVPWENVVYPATLDLLWWKKGQYNWQDYSEETTIASDNEGDFITEYRVNWEKFNAEQKRYNDLIVKYEQKVDEIKTTHTFKVPRTKGRLLTLGAVGSLDSVPNKVYL